MTTVTTKLFTAALVFGAAVSTAIPASADPSIFGKLSCSCEQPPLDGNVAVWDQVNLGIQRGLEDLHANQARRNLPSSNYAPTVSTGNYLR